MQRFGLWYHPKKTAVWIRQWRCAEARVLAVDGPVVSGFQITMWRGMPQDQESSLTHLPPTCYLARYLRIQGFDVPALTES